MIIDDIDLSIALKKLHQLQLEEGDLGAAYWLSISRLLENTYSYRERVLDAEKKLKKIEKIISQ